MIRRKPIDDEEDNHERWLVSYADLVTLLFAFFVVMYGISSVNISKYESLSKSVGTAFIGVEAGSGQTEEADNAQHMRKDSFIEPLPMSQLQQKAKSDERKTMQSMGKEVAEKMTDTKHDGNVRIFEVDKGIRIDISERLLFNPGQAKIKSGGEKILLDIAKDLAKSRKYVQVEGHTDINPIHTKQFPSNWELSTARATSVLQILVKGGVLETRLSAIGYGASQPLTVMDTPEALEANRRVSVIALYESATPNTEGNEIKLESAEDKPPQLIKMPGKSAKQPSKVPAKVEAKASQQPMQSQIQPFTPSS